MNFQNYLTAILWRRYYAARWGSLMERMWLRLARKYA